MGRTVPEEGDGLCQIIVKCGKRIRGRYKMKPESMKMSSRLIDNIYGYATNHVLIGNEFYLAKPIMNVTLKKKLSWCVEILRGKAIAIHFKEDEA